MQMLHIYLFTFTCHIDRYGFARLPYRVAPMGDMFQQEIDEIFKALPHVFGFANNNLLVDDDDDG